MHSIGSDTCPFCDSWNLRETTTETETSYFCRNCGESWVDNDENSSSLWQSNSELFPDDSYEAS